MGVKCFLNNREFGFKNMFPFSTGQKVLERFSERTEIVCDKTSFILELNELGIS